MAAAGLHLAINHVGAAALGGPDAAILARFGPPRGAAPTFRVRSVRFVGAHLRVRPDIAIFAGFGPARGAAAVGDAGAIRMPMQSRGPHIVHCAVQHIRPAAAFSPPGFSLTNIKCYYII